MKRSALLFLLISCFYSGYSQNPPFTDIGFENLPQGINTSTAWINTTGQVANSITCPQVNNPITYALAPNTASVVPVPLLDPMCYNVSLSPFPGNQVMCLNKGLLGTGTRTRLRQNFFVTMSNFIYSYAYVGVLDAGHTFCSGGSLIFNFYDCNNALIAPLSRTVSPSNMNTNNIDAPFWTLGAPMTPVGPTSGAMAYTPAWVSRTENLSSYIGSCVTVEVIVSPCTCGGWYGHAYYDSESSNRLFSTMNSTLLGSGSTYTVCASSTTLTGVSGFGSYSWQGPPNSGVSGSTTQAVSTSAPGNYTLTTVNGTLTLVQTFNLTFAGSPTLSLTASSPTTCMGGTVNLQASGNAVTNCTWDAAPGYTNLAMAVSPAVNTIYAASTINSFGCAASGSIAISVLPSPQLVQISASSPSACPGEVVTLSALGNANVSYTWSTGSNASAISQTLAAPAIFAVYATNTLGCVSSTAITVGVFPFTPVQISASGYTTCANQSLVLTVPGSAALSYTWSNGQTNQPTTVQFTGNTVYTVSATDINGCVSSASVLLSSYPVPAVQLSAPSLICEGQGLTVISNATLAASYLWNTGAVTPIITDVPTSSSIYSLTVLSQAGCPATASVAVTVAPLPTAQIIAPLTPICFGESASLSGAGNGGITSYAWSNGSTGLSILVTPSATTFYTLTVTDNNGCSASAAYMLEVSECTGIAENAADPFGLDVFPNPAAGLFTVKGSGDLHGVLLNGLGQLVKEFDLNAANNFQQSFSDLVSGVYFVRTPVRTAKVIVK